MGYAISWIAVKSKSPDLVLQELGLSPTGEMTDYAEAPVTGRTLPTGWFLMVLNQYGHKFIKPKLLALLSSECDVIACAVEEHVMVSSSELWRNGEEVWRIEHDAQNNVRGQSQISFQTFCLCWLAYSAPCV